MPTAYARGASPERQEARQGREDVVRMPIELLEPGHSIRIGGLRADHLTSVMQLGGNWPPLLVTGAGRIVDGNYRYAAALRLGHSFVDTQLFEGDDVETLLEAIRRNARQGLPLTLEERRTAARRVLLCHAEWSDRRIAALCGLAHETVGRLRGGLCRGGEIRHLDRRIGRDGKSQPLRRSVPCPSPRGEPPGTESGNESRGTEAPGAESAGPGAPAPESLGTPERGHQATPALSSDLAFISTEQGRSFAEWFERRAVDGDWSVHVRRVPLSRVYPIVDEARRRARAWDAFADALASRATRATS